MVYQSRVASKHESAKSARHIMHVHVSNTGDDVVQAEHRRSHSGVESAPSEGSACGGAARSDQPTTQAQTLSNRGPSVLSPVSVSSLSNTRNNCLRSGLEVNQSLPLLEEEPLFCWLNMQSTSDQISKL